MPRIKDVRTTIYEWVGPVAPMPPHFCTTASDLVSDVTGSISGFRFLGWLVVELELDDGTIGIGNSALAPHAVKTTIDTYLKPLLIGTDPLDSEYIWQSMYRRTLPFGRKGIGMTAIVAADKAEAALRFIQVQGHRAWVIGEVVKGFGATRLVG